MFMCKDFFWCMFLKSSSKMLQWSFFNNGHPVLVKQRAWSHHICHISLLVTRFSRCDTAVLIFFFLSFSILVQYSLAMFSHFTIVCHAIAVCAMTHCLYATVNVKKETKTICGTFRNPWDKTVLYMQKKRKRWLNNWCENRFLKMSFKCYCQ